MTPIPCIASWPAREIAREGHRLVLRPSDPAMRDDALWRETLGSWLADDSGIMPDFGSDFTIRTLAWRALRAAGWTYRGEEWGRLWLCPEVTRG